MCVYLYLGVSVCLRLCLFFFLFDRLFVLEETFVFIFFIMFYI